MSWLILLTIIALAWLPWLSRVEAQLQTPRSGDHNHAISYKLNVDNSLTLFDTTHNHYLFSQWSCWVSIDLLMGLLQDLLMGFYDDGLLWGMGGLVMYTEGKLPYDRLVAVKSPKRVQR
ncbi:hypothetical protein OIU76_028010 [Salix suchowensis]|nr:hypothetical protein OIU76_028010 [Salix suchowensis]